MNPHYSSYEAIQTLVARFDARTLPVAEFTHEAHLTVAVWYLAHHSLEEATCFIRSGIITYNLASGTPNNPTRGYHETMTLFWIRTVNRYVRNHAGTDVLLLVNNFLQTPLASRNYPFEFFSREHMFTTTARAFWVEPDVKKLDW